jgi:hypothetical protein
VRPELKHLWDLYVAAEDGPVRIDALAALGAVVDDVATTDDRDDLARVALRWEAHGRHRRLREPLMQTVVRPYLADHLPEPDAVLAMLRVVPGGGFDDYVGMDPITHDGRVGALKHALALVDDPRLWDALVDIRIGHLEWGTHHLDEGHGLVDGSFEEYLLILADTLFLIGQAPTGSLDDARWAEVEEQWQLMRDWRSFADAGRDGADFSVWCRLQGRTHWVASGPAWSRTYYPARGRAGVHRQLRLRDGHERPPRPT